MNFILLTQGMSSESRLLLLILLLLLAAVLLFLLRKEELECQKKPYHYSSYSNPPYDWDEFRQDLLYAWKYCLGSCFMRFAFLRKIFKKTAKKYFISDDEIIWEQVEINDEYILLQKKEKIPHKKNKK